MSGAAEKSGWVSRETFTDVVGRPRSARGLLVTSSEGDVVAPLEATDLAEARTITRETLAAAGVLPDDRVVVALNSDGDLTGTLMAEAAAECAQLATSSGPRGRLRLTALIERVRANVLITTPSGAMDLLARLHMEFLADPLDLELRMLLVVGEIADVETFGHLGREFDTEVIEVFCDPVLGVALGHRHPLSEDPTWQITREGTVDVEPLNNDHGQREETGGGPLGEIVVNHVWHTGLSNLVLRSGYVCSLAASDGGIGAIEHTVGDFVMIRGRWVCLSALERALSHIDGISRLRLEIDRPGTLDSATLHTWFARETLVSNPMWRGRIVEALTRITPVHIDVEIADDVVETPCSFEVLDRRGHHLLDGHHR